MRFPRRSTPDPGPTRFRSDPSQLLRSNDMTETATTADKFKEATSSTIDDADIAKDRAALGVWAASRSQELISTATPEAIRNFANGYGDDNPLYTDPRYGEATRWGGQ